MPCGSLSATNNHLINYKLIKRRSWANKPWRNIKDNCTRCLVNIWLNKDCGEAINQEREVGYYWPLLYIEWRQKWWQIRQCCWQTSLCLHFVLLKTKFSKSCERFWNKTKCSAENGIGWLSSNSNQGSLCSLPTNVNWKEIV